MTKNDIYRKVRMEKGILEDWDCGPLLTKELQIPRVTRLPTRDEIYGKIICIKDYNYETYECIWKYIYYDKKTGIRAEHTVRMGISECEEAINDEESMRNLNQKLNSVKQALVDQVIAEYKKRYYSEVCNMNNQQFDNLLHNVQRLDGNITLEAHGFGYPNIAKIEIPACYLGLLKIDQPEPKKESWIEGLPAVKKVETYNDCVVKVTFIDDTFTKAVCSENDHFDLDVGITICAMKRMLGEKGNQYYNDFIRKVHKVIVENDIAKEKAAKEKAEAKMKRRKIELKKAAKKLKAKEEQIDIQTQAIIRAHDEIEARQKEEGLK